MPRLYLCKIRGDGVTFETAFRPAFNDLLPGKLYNGVSDPRRAKVAFIAADTDAAEHTILLASGEVREIPLGILNTRRGDLTAGQAAAVNDVLTMLGFSARVAAIFTADATVFDMVRWMFGHIEWQGLRDLGI